MPTRADRQPGAWDVAPNSGGGAQLSEQIVQAAPLLILVLDVEGRVQHVNPFFERVTGRRLAELKGEDWFETGVPEREREESRARFAQCRGGEGVQARVTRIVTADGGEREIEWSEECIRDAEGHVSSVVVIGQHVTQGSRAEVALRQSEQRLREVQRLAGLGSVDWDLSTGWLSLSEEACDIAGLDPNTGSLPIEEVFALFHPEDRERVQKSLQDAIDGVRRHDIEHRMVRPDGSIVHVRATAEVSRDSAGKPTRVLGTVLDITERRRIKQRLELAQALAKIGSWEIRFATSTVWWSDESFRILGMDANVHQPSYEAYMAAVHPADRSRVDAAFRRGLERRESYEIEHRILTAQGELKHIRAQVRLTFSSGGTPVLALGTIQDVSAQALSAQLLREAQRIAKLGSWELDLSSNALDWSDEIFRIFEIDPAQFGASYEAFLDAVHQDDRQAVAQAYSDSLRTGEPYEIIHRLRMPDGRIKHVHERCETYYGADGTPLRSVGTVQDVSSRVQAEERVRELDARFATAFHENPIALCIRRLDDHLILEVNAACEQLVATPREALIGNTVAFIGPSDCEAIQQYTAKRQPVRGLEVQLVDATGCVRDTSMTVSYVTVGGEECVLVSFVDVAERKAAELLTRRHLLEKETLLREIHHRVKNNLQVISGLLHFQAKKLRAPEDAGALAELRQRIFAMTLLHERLYQSSDISRIAFGDYVRALVADQVRSSALRKDIEVDVIADEVLLPIELAMPTGLIVSELVSNVLKYAFPTGRPGVARVSLSHEAGRIVVSVDDDGVGLPEGFDPAVAGSFGWEIVRALVRQLEGTVTASSRNGAHVLVSFPAPQSIEGDVQ